MFAMTPDEKGLWSMVARVIGQHGTEACAFALERAKACLEEDDLERLDIWVSVAERCHEFLRLRLAAGESYH